MKLFRFSISVLLCFAIFWSCNSSKKAASKPKKATSLVETSTKIDKMLDKLSADLITATNGNAEVLRTSGGINITFQPDFYFESSSDQLTSEAKSSLNDISTVLNRYPYTEVFIEGHADSSGNQLNNKKLSETRAKNVALYLKSNGVTAERMAIAGYGATRPLASNETPEGRRKNRRVVVKIRANEAEFLNKEKEQNEGNKSNR